jgi:glycosyltransferase involved in cell wall biosynthesis
VRKILFVIPNAGPGGVASQVALLAGGLARDRCQVRVCSLDDSAPTEGLTAGDVESLGWGRVVDARPFLRLRQIVHEFQPDIIHSWSPPAFRAVALAAVCLGGRRVVSRPFVAAERCRNVSALDRWLLKRADRVIAGSSFEETECRRVGLAPEQNPCILPGIALPALDATRDETRRRLALPDGARWLACAGPLEEHKGFRDAIWAIAMLQFLFPDLHLVIVGAGPALGGLRHFLHNAVVKQAINKVHFAGVRSDLTAILGHADIVWVPSRADAGRCVALEAMALGRPVVASGVGSLGEIVVDGITGVLVQPAAPAGLALQTRLLLEDAAQARSLGEAGLERARSHFSLAQFVAHHERLYESIS